MYKSEKKFYKKAFLTAMLMAVVLFLPFVIIDGGYFIFYGDYNAQQIPFFKMCVEAVRSGNVGWDWHTDLGANFVGSYTYYTLGSPFFWIMTLFPSSISQYLMAPLLCVKIGLMSLFAFMYIKRFVNKPESALLGGILYAFSSFNLYNIFFQFQDAFMYFPLMLIGLEEAVVNKRRGLFAITVAINCLANYFFFIGQCIFLVIYFFIRWIYDKQFRVNVKGFLCLAFESVVGVMIASVLFIPSIMQVLDVPRSTNILKDWSFLFFGNEQRYGLLLESMFFPPEVAARSNMFTEANAKWSSVALYLPLFGMAGVIAFMKGAKGHWARAIIAVCLIMAFVPGLNAMFTLFNNNYYTRWFYMPELIFCLATVYTLEHGEFDLKLGLKFSAVAAALIGGLAVLAPFTVKSTDKEGNSVSELYPRFLTDMKPTVWLTLAICAAFLVVLGIMIKVRPRFTKADFTKKVTVATVICSMVLGYYFIGYGRAIGPYIGRYNKMASAEFDIDDPDFYRIEGINETNNFNMFHNMSSLKSFTSIIPGSTFDLYDTLGIKRTVNSAPENTYYAFRAFSRVKYIMIPNDMGDEKRQEALDDLKIYEYMDTQGMYDIYKTDYALPMGFAYDTYFPIDKVKGSDHADKLMVRSAFLTDEQAVKYKDIVTPDDTSYVFSYDQFKLDAMDKIANGVSQFSISKTGFTAVSDYDSDKLVVFSVPYCKGWSATVNGEPVEVDKINGGLCGIRVPGGNCNISFTYETPGLKIGIIVTIIGAVLWVAYFVFNRYVIRHKSRAYAHTYYSEPKDVKAHDSYIRQLTRQIGDCPDKGFVKEDDRLEFPEIGESFMDTERYDFSKRVPKKRTSHITEDDEAFRVMEELDREKNKKDDDE